MTPEKLIELQEIIYVLYGPFFTLVMALVMFYVFFLTLIVSLTKIKITFTVGERLMILFRKFHRPSRL